MVGAIRPKTVGLINFACTHSLFCLSAQTCTPRNARAFCMKIDHRTIFCCQPSGIEIPKTSHRRARKQVAQSMQSHEALWSSRCFMNMTIFLPCKCIADFHYSDQAISEHKIQLEMTSLVLISCSSYPRDSETLHVALILA